MLFQGESFATRTKAIEHKHQNYEEGDGEVVEKKKSKHKKYGEREHRHKHKKSKKGQKGSISPVFSPKNDYGSHYSTPIIYKNYGGF